MYVRVCVCVRVSCVHTYVEQVCMHSEYITVLTFCVWYRVVVSTSLILPSILLI